MQEPTTIAWVGPIGKRWMDRAAYDAEFVALAKGASHGINTYEY